MAEIALTDVFTLNEELAALAEVGFPLAFAPHASPQAVSATLERINESLKVRSGLGQSLETAAAESQDLPPAYRDALVAGLRCHDLSATLDGLSRQAIAANELHGTVGRSLVPPLIVLMLAYFGSIVLCLTFTPTIAGIYEQVEQPYSTPVRVLLAIRDALPYWAVLVPLLAVGAAALWLRGWDGWRRWVPGAAQYAANVRHANFAHKLRRLLENGVSHSEGLPVAAAVTEDRGLIDAATTLSMSLSTDRTNDGDLEVESQALNALPPLLRWALTGDLGGQSLPEVLRFAEKTYLHKVERRAAVWRFFLPAVIGALLGGAVVLAYGLSVFGPFTQLLHDLSGSGGPR